MSKSSVRQVRPRTRRLSIKKLLFCQLESIEIKIISDVVRAEREGKQYRATRLGLAESLVRRQWLVRDADGTIHISTQTRGLLEECAQ